MWTWPWAAMTPSLPLSSWDQLGSELVRGQYQGPQVLELVPQLEEFCGGEQDGIEGVHHGGRKLEVLFPEQDVCHRMEDVLCIQQEAELPRKQAREAYPLEGTCSLPGLQGLSAGMCMGRGPQGVQQHTGGLFTSQYHLP